LIARRVYQVELNPADTPGIPWEPYGPTAHGRWTMRPSYLKLEFIERTANMLPRVPVLQQGEGAPEESPQQRGWRLLSGSLMGRRIPRNGKEGIWFAEKVMPDGYLAWPYWLRLAVDMAEAKVNGQYKPQVGP
jgi:hypothetical protein